jgi:hypothetical protein
VSGTLTREPTVAADTAAAAIDADSCIATKAEVDALLMTVSGDRVSVPKRCGSSPIARDRVDDVTCFEKLGMPVVSCSGVERKSEGES